MSSLALYRELIPGHAAVDDAHVEQWLTLAARRHTAGAFGAVYAEAMVFYAAAKLEPMFRSGAVGLTGAACVPPSTSTKPETSTTGEPYWSWYVELRNTRAASAVRWVAPWL